MGIDSRPVWFAAAMAAFAGVSAVAGSGAGAQESGPEAEAPLIVSIGDSIASGEGNPDKPASGRREETWLGSTRCHRSMISGHAMAIGRLRRAYPEEGILYQSFACSGATTAQLLDEPYDGVEPQEGEPPEAPQLDQLKALAAEADVEAVMVSAGANDLGFSKIVRFCALVGGNGCWRRGFDPQVLSRESPGKKPLDEYVDDRLRDLDASYDRLADELDDVVPDDRVLIAEYPDPTLDAKGNPCPMLFGRVQPEESRWARSEVLVQLNELIAEKADEHGWRLVDDVDEGFGGHGICAGGARWIVTLFESADRQGSLAALAALADLRFDSILNRVNAFEGSFLGTLHPNEDGHRATAGLIRAELAEALELEDPGDDPEETHDAEVFGLPIPAAIAAAVVLLGAAAIAARFLSATSG